MVKAPNDKLEAYKEVKAVPEPTKSEADKVLVVSLFHVKFGDCKIVVVSLPVKIWFAVNVDAPVPPLEIDNVPDDTFVAFKLVSEAPEPEKVGADTLVLDIVVPVKGPDHKPPVQDKTNDSVEDIFTPIPYISLCCCQSLL